MSDGETSIWSRLSYREAVRLHCTLENGSDLHVNVARRYNTSALRLLKNKKEEEKCKVVIFTSRSAHINCADVIHHSIGNQL